jgi:hypothetical protein
MTLLKPICWLESLTPQGAFYLHWFFPVLGVPGVILLAIALLYAHGRSAPVLPHRRAPP